MEAPSVRFHPPGCLRGCDGSREPACGRGRPAGSWCQVLQPGRGLGFLTPAVSVAFDFPSGVGTCHPAPTTHPRRIVVYVWRVYTWRTAGVAFAFPTQRQCQRRRGEARVSAGLNDELTERLAIITSWKRRAPGSLLPREGAVFTHTKAAALGAGLGLRWRLLQLEEAGALFLPWGFMTHTQVEYVEDSGLFFFVGLSFSLLTSFVGEILCSLVIWRVERHRSEYLLGPGEEVLRKRIS